MVTTMSFPIWAPITLVEWLEDYPNDARFSSATASERDGVPDLRDMWLRLLTRPEMEAIWNFVAPRHSSLSLVANGGILGKINRDILGYGEARRVSPSEYMEEMNEIATLASALARKLRAYSGPSNRPNNYYNPFHIDYILNNNDLLRIEGILSSEYVGEYELTGGRISGAVLRETLPQLGTMLTRLSAIASNEAECQDHRLLLPKKVKGTNAFRTYFIKEISDFFSIQLLDFSPTRIATFCCVALDDPLITPDLVRKTFPISQEEREIFKAAADYFAQPED